MPQMMHPTSANIRDRISAAQRAVDEAMDLLKQHPEPPRRALSDLNQAYSWLVSAHRRMF